MREKRTDTVRCADRLRRSRFVFPLLLTLLLTLLSLTACGARPGEAPTPAGEKAASWQIRPLQAEAVPELLTGKTERSPQTGSTWIELGTESEPCPVRISEVMSSNKATLADRNGNFGDWVELSNPSDHPFELAGCVLRCGGDRWSFPEYTLGAGERLVIFCDRTPDGELSDSGELHTDFAISAHGEELRFYDRAGELVDLFPAVELPEDCSAVRGTGTEPSVYFDAGNAPYSATADGTASDVEMPVISEWPTPGFENSEEGWVAFQLSRAAQPESLVISEAMSSNPEGCGPDGLTGDWVELYNSTKTALNLEDYCLSDRESERVRAVLPALVLEPGDYAVIRCSAEETGGLRVPFGLNAEKEELYLSLLDGTLCDYVNLRGLPSGCSIGREPEGGFFYYASPTPGSENNGGVRFTGTMPVLLGEDGIFNDVTEVTVSLSGPGTVRYTLDGSLPTENSAVYTEPLTLRETGVVRAACFQEDHLPGKVLNLSYLINEGHELPVVSVVCDPEGMFASPGGVYNSPQLDLEIPGAVMFYEDGSGFRHDCGVKLHGATSKFVQKKKSLKLTFRNRYGGALEYPVFDSDVTQFSSLLLRSGQEGQSSSYMRDALMHEMAKECFPELPSQDHRYAALYINGQYWGLYNIREAHSEEHYANHYGYDVDKVTHWHEKWDKPSTVEDIYQYALTHDLSQQEEFDHVAEHLNLDSIIAWLILQDYGGNMDFNSPNMRFYWSEEDQLLRYALVDLDLSLFTAGNMPSLTYRGYYAYNKLAGALMKNEGFRRDLCIRLNTVLSGPMSDENVLLMIDRFADEMRPEIEREKVRWGGRVAEWDHLVDEIRRFITKNNGQAKNMVRFLTTSGAISTTEAEEYLSDFVIHRAK